MVAFTMVLIPIRQNVQQSSIGPESIQDKIIRITQDIQDLKRFYHISISPTRESRLRQFYTDELHSLRQENFEAFDQNGKIDYLLLQNYLRRQLRNLDLQTALDKRADVLLSSYAPNIVQLCEERVRVIPMDAKWAAEKLSMVHAETVKLTARVRKTQLTVDKFSAFRAARILDELKWHLREWFHFYNRYDPLYSWWVPEPYGRVDRSLHELADAIRSKIVGIQPRDQDAIVGEPIGRQGLLAELEAEMIDYSPEEILSIGERERQWCEEELRKASQELGYGDDWRKALEYVKELYVEPGQQRNLVQYLAWEAIDFVRTYDLITVPPLASDLWQTFMMSPERQKANPFFLGGDSIQVSYPTADMSQADKIMSLRANNKQTALDKRADVLLFLPTNPTCINGSSILIKKREREREKNPYFFYAEQREAQNPLVKYSASDFCKVSGFVHKHIRIRIIFPAEAVLQNYMLDHV